MKRSHKTILILAVISTLLFSIYLYRNFSAERTTSAADQGTKVRTDVVSPEPDITTIATNTTGIPLKLPPGFSASIFARGLGKARVMVEDPSGVLIVSTSRNGRVVALPDKNNDGVADQVINVIGGLNNPHGLAFQCSGEVCKLYIAETDQVAVYDYNRTTFKATNRKNLAGLPGGGGHSTRTILFLPPPNDHILLVSVGSSCNVCKESDWRRAAILQLDTKTGKLSPYATGLRNSVFMQINPHTKQVWATDNGRDYLGDNLPPDEINIIEKGKFYGWPYCYGKKILDTNFENSQTARNKCAGSVPSLINIQAHSAALGLAFFPSTGWQGEYQGDVLVALHGSWNRSVPTGYKIIRHQINQDGSISNAEDFITGWLQGNGAVLGRPVDILITDRGTIFITDDNKGVVYLVSRQQ